MKRDAGGRSARERGGPPVCLPRSLPRRLLREGTGADERPWPAALRRGGGKAAAAPSSSPALSPRWEGELRAGLGACYRWVSPGKAGAGRRGQAGGGRPPAAGLPPPARTPSTSLSGAKKTRLASFLRQSGTVGGRGLFLYHRPEGLWGAASLKGEVFGFFFFVVVGILALR